MSAIKSIVADAIKDAKEQLAANAQKSVVLVKGEEQAVVREPHPDQKLKAAMSAVSARDAEIRAAIVAEVAAGL